MKSTKGLIICQGTNAMTNATPEEFHPDIVAAATEIVGDDAPKAELVVSTAVMVVCSLISLGLQCYRWRTEGGKTATNEAMAAALAHDMNTPPNYDGATDSFNPRLIRQMLRQAHRAARKHGERISNSEATVLAIRSLRQAQKGAISASCMACITPEEEIDDGGN